MKKYLILLMLPLLGFIGCQNQSAFEVHETIYVRHKGADMPAYVHGNAEEKIFLLVLHGAGSYGLAFRDGVFTAELEKRYVVVYHDQRGQGMSQGQYPKAEDIAALMAEDVVALAKVLKTKYGEDIKLFLMGHSWGGALSGTVLVKDDQQSLFKGWINVDGVHDFPLAGFSRHGFLLQLADEQIAMGNEVDGWEEIRRELEGLSPDSETDYPLILAQARKAIGLLNDAGVVENSLSSEKLKQAIFANNPITYFVSSLLNRPFEEARDMDYSIRNDMEKLTLPCLLVWGAYDVSVPPEVGEDAFAALKNSVDRELLIFDRSLHHPHDTEPERFGEAVVDFIERNK